MAFLSSQKQDQPVVEIMALWQPGEGRDTSGLPARGFAGQIFFFEQGSKSPTKIEGDIAVYVFDDQGTPEEQRKPIHVYEFKSGAWNGYLTETNIGNAYQVFIPYPRSGDHKAVCSIRVKHTSAKGETLLSDPADIILAGKTVKAETEVKVSAERAHVPSTLSTQQTHVATIGRSGKVKPTAQTVETVEQATAENTTENLTETKVVGTTIQKNTTISNYQKKASSVEQAAHLTQEDSESTADDEFELTGWSLHRDLPHQLQQASFETHEDNEPAEFPVSVRTSVSSKQPTRPAAHPLAEQTSSTKHSTRFTEESAQPLFFEHPLTKAEKSVPTAKSSLKVKTITLE